MPSLAHHIVWGAQFVGLILLLVGAGVAEGQVSKPVAELSRSPRSADRPSVEDNETFRPTVLIRKGPARGSGTVIASVNDETLILTVWHVVRGEGELDVELHRYNLGIERRTQLSAGWPRRVPAEVLVKDEAADLAILRIRKMVALPYVAKLAPGDQEPAPRTVVTSLGIDQATHLTSWTARVLGVAQLDPHGKGVEHPFLITDRAPEHGRSGGGLFRADGCLVGVCVGRTEPPEGSKAPSIGIFASCTTVRRLIREHNLEPVIALSSRTHPKPRSTSRPRSPGLSPITETDHRVPQPGR